MPNRPRKKCIKPGCTVLVGYPECYCAAHKPIPPASQWVDQRPPSSQRGYTADWRHVREAVLLAEPLCRICHQFGILTTATVVDHITPLDFGGDRLDEKNLQPLCCKCHRKKTSTERGAFGRRRKKK